MKRIPLILSLLSCAIQSQTIDITGRVTWNAIGIPNAEVRLAQFNLQAITDSTGVYTLSGQGTAVGPVALTQSGTRIRLEAERVEISLGRSQSFGMALYDLTGARIVELPPRRYDAGTHAISLPRLASSGNVLVCRIQAGDHRRSVLWTPLAARQTDIGTPAGSAARSAAAIGQIQVSASGFETVTAPLAALIDTVNIDLSKDASWNAKRHLWVWGSDWSTPAGMAQLFTFAQQKDIATFYPDCGGLITSAPQLVGAFIQSAAERRCDVELLFGQADWALTANHGEPLALTNAVLSLVNTLKSQNKPLPTGIQFDVEPYSLPQWTADLDATANQLIDMYEKLNEALQGSGIGLTACIPRWFDGIALTRDNQTRPLSQWLADITDRLTLMDYVDNATAIINDAANEMNYADSTAKQVVIGVETMEGLGTVSFADKGEAAMNTALSAVYEHYKTAQAFSGIAIHHYGSYQTLKP